MPPEEQTNLRISNKSPSITDEVKSLKKKGKHTTISG
jgi:hypothetical protein